MKVLVGATIRRFRGSGFYNATRIQISSRLESSKRVIHKIDPVNAIICITVGGCLISIFYALMIER